MMISFHMPGNVVNDGRRHIVPSPRRGEGQGEGAPGLNENLVTPSPQPSPQNGERERTVLVEMLRQHKGRP